MARAGGADCRCAERRGGDHLCPLVLSLVLHDIVRRTADSAWPANLGALGCLPGRTCRLAGAWPVDLAEFYRRKIRRDGPGRTAGDVLAGRVGGRGGICNHARSFPNCFFQLDAGGIGGGRACLRAGATVALSIAGDRGQPLRDCAPSRQHSAAAGRVRATPWPRQPGIESRFANLARDSHPSAASIPAALSRSRPHAQRHPCRRGYGGGQARRPNAGGRARRRPRNALHDRHGPRDRPARG